MKFMQESKNPIAQIIYSLCALITAITILVIAVR